MYKDFAEGEAAPALEEEGCCSPRQRWCRRLEAGKPPPGYYRQLWT